MSMRGCRWLAVGGWTMLVRLLSLFISLYIYLANKKTLQKNSKNSGKNLTKIPVIIRSNLVPRAEAVSTRGG